MPKISVIIQPRLKGQPMFYTLPWGPDALELRTGPLVWFLEG